MAQRVVNVVYSLVDGGVSVIEPVTGLTAQGKDRREASKIITSLLDTYLAGDPEVIGKWTDARQNHGSVIVTF